MSFKKLLICTYLGLAFINSSAMEFFAREPDVKAYFLPRDQAEFVGDLYTALDAARSEVLVAMYWLTDSDIINKFKELQERGVNVNIILDQTSIGSEDVTERLGASKIYPIVLPKNAGLMHNKFIIIDGELLFTGSVNFTNINLSPRQRQKTGKFNDENILAVSLNDIAAQYKDNFYRIERNILEEYITLVAGGQRLDYWLWRLVKNIKDHNPRFAALYTNIFSRFGPDEQRNLERTFGRIEDFRPRKRARVDAPAWGTEPPATEPQIRYIRGLLGGAEPPEGLSKKAASQLINRLKFSARYQ